MTQGPPTYLDKRYATVHHDRKYHAAQLPSNHIILHEYEPTTQRITDNYMKMSYDVSLPSLDLHTPFISNQSIQNQATNLQRLPFLALTMDPTIEVSLFGKHLISQRSTGSLIDTACPHAFLSIKDRIK